MKAHLSALFVLLAAAGFFGCASAPTTDGPRKVAGGNYRIDCLYQENRSEGIYVLVDQSEFHSKNADVSAFYSWINKGADDQPMPTHLVARKKESNGQFSVTIVSRSSFITIEGDNFNEGSGKVFFSAMPNATAKDRSQATPANCSLR